MTINIGNTRYTPGTYAKTRPSAAELAENYIHEWEKKRIGRKEKDAVETIPPTICFSRKIGVGALEVADILAEKIGYKVVDREILECIASEAKLSEKTVAIFDERYPGKISEFLSLAFGEKAFIKSDYTRHLFSVVYSIAGLEPTIFVGRGTHLLLPRDRLMAVRFICSKAHRVRRLAALFDVKEQEAENKLELIDKEQRDFFKRVYGKKDASPYEFDITVNFDYISEPQWAADIVDSAFKKKFGS
jgi:cytidylate kinase